MARPAVSNASTPCIPTCATENDVVSRFLVRTATPPSANSSSSGPTARPPPAFNQIAAITMPTTTVDHTTINAAMWSPTESFMAPHVPVSEKRRGPLMDGWVRGTATHDPGYSLRAVKQSVVRTLGLTRTIADEVRLADGATDLALAGSPTDHCADLERLARLACRARERLFGAPACP